MRHKDVLVIVPVYNESHNLSKVISSLKIFFKNILVIDDGSEDNSLNILKELDVNLIKHPINLGQGAAIETGLNYLLNNKVYKYAVTFDGDGQNYPSDASKMTDFAKQNSLDAVVGSRFLRRDDNEEMPMLRKIVLRLANFYERIFYSTKFSDAHNGLRVLERNFIYQYLMPIKNHDMSHATEISYKICRNTKKFKEYPIKVKYANKRSQSLLNAINIVFQNIFHPFS